MVLPLYLAMTASEFRPVPYPALLMLTGTEQVPPGVLPVLTDCFPLDGQALQRICQGQEALLLDCVRPPTTSLREIIQGLPCPCGAPPGYTEEGPVFLPPAPMHIPLDKYLTPYRSREIWLEAALQKQVVTVTPKGVTVSVPCTNHDLNDGFYSEILHCRFVQNYTKNQVVFTLFDTSDTIRMKLDHAASLGAVRAVGLFQELGEKHMSTY